MQAHRGTCLSRQGAPQPSERLPCRRPTLPSHPAYCEARGFGTREISSGFVGSQTLWFGRRRARTCAARPQALDWAGRAGPGHGGLGWARRESSELGRTGLQPGFGPPPAPRPAAGRSRSAPLTLRKSSGGAGAAHAQEAGRKRHTRHTGRRRQNRDQDGGARGEEGKLRVCEARSAGSRVQVTVPQRRARARARGSPPVRPTALTADCLCFSSRSPSGGLCLRCLQPCAFRSSPGPLRSSGCPRRSPSQAAVPAAR